MNIIQDIIDLKKKHNLEEQDATYVKQVEWYSWAIPNGYIETEYIDNKLLGFAEWVRLPETVDNRFQASGIFDYRKAKTAPVLFIANVIATEPGVIWRLKKKVLSKNKDYDVIQWQRRKDDKLVTLRRGNV